MSRGWGRRPGLTLVLLAALGCASAAVEPPPSGPPEFARFVAVYKLSVIVEPRFPISTTYGTIGGNAASAVELADYSDLFIQEFSLYPQDLVRRSNLKRVVLCKELSLDGQRRNAIPDSDHNTLYLDVVRGIGNRAYMRKVIHHEFFHIIDLRDDGEIYKDDRWASLNPPGFQYGSGGREAQNVSQTGHFSDQYPGFLNHYSTTGVEEDKAEVYAAMIIASSYVADRGKRDRFLNSKFAQMKQLILRFSPEMNDEFWRRAAAANRDDERSQPVSEKHETKPGGKPVRRRSERKSPERSSLPNRR